METGGGGLAAQQTDLLDEFFLEVCCEVALGAEEDYPSLGDCGWLADTRGKRGVGGQLVRASSLRSSSELEACSQETRLA